MENLSKYLKLESIFIGGTEHKTMDVSVLNGLLYSNAICLGRIEDISLEQSIMIDQVRAVPETKKSPKYLTVKVKPYEELLKTFHERCHGGYRTLDGAFFNDDMIDLCGKYVDVMVNSLNCCYHYMYVVRGYAFHESWVEVIEEIG